MDIEDDDFNWLDFFRAQWKETVTTEKIGDFQNKYQGSEEEKRDVLSAYTRFRGDLNKIFNSVMLSNPLNDEDRFGEYIRDAISAEEVEAFDAFIHEPESRRKARHKRAQKEAQQAEKHAEDLGLSAGKKGGAKGAESSEEALLQMMQQRNKGRAATFLDDLEAKYAAPKKGKAEPQSGKRKQPKEPPEEAFQQMGARGRGPKSQLDVKLEDEDEDQESEDDGFVSEEDDEVTKPARKRQKPAVSTNGKKAKGKMKG